MAALCLLLMTSMVLTMAAPPIKHETNFQESELWKTLDTSGE